MATKATHIGGLARRRKTGLAAVETAIVVPLLLLLAFAAVDFGRVMHADLVVSNAARCGAEYGSMHKVTPFTRTFWESQVRQAIVNEMQAWQGFQENNLQHAITTTTDSDGLVLSSVRVTYPFNTIVSWPGIPAQVVLSHEVEMRQSR